MQSVMGKKFFFHLKVTDERDFKKFYFVNTLALLYYL